MSTQRTKFDREHPSGAASLPDSAEKLSYAALARALDISPNAVFFMTTDLRIVGANAVGHRCLGFCNGDLESVSFIDLVASSERGRLIGLAQRLLRGETRGGLLTTRLRSKTGRTLAVRLRIQLIDHSAEPQLVAVAQSGSIQRRVSESPSRRVSQDYVTGLPMRDALEFRLRLTERRAKRRRGRFAVLFIDLDDFKNVNDVFGHVVGDEILRIAAERLKACVRPSDFVARYGGDEFVAVIENVGEEAEVEAIAGRVRAELSDPVSLRGRQLEISASVGVAVGQPSASARALVGEADQAMYRAKSDPLRRFGSGPTPRRDRNSEAARKPGGVGPEDALADVKCVASQSDALGGART
jgi:diguanylate cyclase (GGDEF)-like protein/PAS domain S-box-containing protein